MIKNFCTLSICKSRNNKDNNLKKSHIKKLKETTIDNENLNELLIQECSICLEKFQQNDITYTTPCMHYFHKDCLLLWLQKNLNCPLCRIDI